MSSHIPITEELIRKYLPSSAKTYIDLLLQGKSVKEVKQLIQSDSAIPFTQRSVWLDQLTRFDKAVNSDPLANVPVDPYTGEKDLTAARAALQARADFLGISLDELILREEFGLFGDFQPSFDFLNTAGRIKKWANDSLTRKNTPPDPINIWECRIGLSRFMVPPTSIHVNQTFQTGAMTGSVIRQQTPPKFGSGHSETSISMNLFFPSTEAIWGFDGNKLTIDFSKDDDAIIDRYLSSLRGLITQFKYAPFLPVRNAYLNKVWGISAVAMQSLTVTNVPDFPFCVQVQLNMLKFNFDTFLPMVTDFNAAIHWGRYRQYMGRAVAKMAEYANKDFLFESGSTSNAAGEDQNAVQTTNPSTYTFDKVYEWETGKYFEIFYPDKDPAVVVGPDLLGFVNPSTQDIDSGSNREWWEKIITGLGWVTGFERTAYDVAKSLSEEIDTSGGNPAYSKYTSEAKLIFEWLKRVNLGFESMGPARFQEYLQKRIDTDFPPGTPGREAALAQLEKDARTAWFAVMMNFFMGDPTLQAALEQQMRRRGWVSIREWEVPMSKLGIDPSKVFVQNVVVSMANNFAKLQIQMREEPTYQHIGGMGTNCSIKMVILGEEELIKIQNVFETINGLARLEHGHAVLGFLGFKNLLTALSGMRYALPVSFDVETIEGYPHAYNVTLELTDFDVFQQRREMLTTDQQAELVEAFGKRNPFLRLQQLWGAFTAYPDFPLDIRDEQGKIIGHLDPDYYFNGVETIEDDIVNWRRPYNDEPGQDNSNTPTDPATARLASPSDPFTTEIFYGPLGPDGQLQKMLIHPGGIDVYEGANPVATNLGWNEPHAGNMTGTSAMGDEFTSAAGYSHPYVSSVGVGVPSNHGDLRYQFDGMLQDLQFRNKSGRMIRAFPTYFLWLIDEGGNAFGNVKMFDNVYGLQSVLDVSIVQSEDVMSDTLQMRISNLYSRLSTPNRNILDETRYPVAAKMINKYWNRTRNILGGLTDAIVEIDTIELKPGVRIHLRMGYGSNPNALDTVFNGRITEVVAGDVMTITAQSDALELSAIINNKDKGASASDIDGGLLAGLWMVEPRDLMVRLLSIGASTFKETISHALRGMIFSESRFGIKHFGSILYESLGPGESNLQSLKVDRLNSVMMGNFVDKKTGSSTLGSGMSLVTPAPLQPLLGATTGQGIFGFLNIGVFDLTSRLWANLGAVRDYEVFKRNIYPGNGTGIAQFLGGDIGDAAPGANFSPTGVSTANQVIHPVTGESIDLAENDAVAALIKNKEIKDRADTKKKNEDNAWNRFRKGDEGAAHIQRRLLGTEGEVHDDDLDKFDEISFRAKTYMRSVWDMFLMCAAVMPNYIVAVRPWMERSTVFYGKPHWSYTSGVIPVTTGVAKDQGPKVVGPDEQRRKLTEAIQQQVKTKEGPNDVYNRLGREAYEKYYQLDKEEGDTGGDPNSPTTLKVEGDQQSILQLPAEHPNRKAKLPFRSGMMGVGMHMAVAATLEEDKQKHVQSGDLPTPWRHPFYMDRIGGPGTDAGQSGSGTTVITGDDPNAPGTTGDFGFLSPEEEKWYIRMPFPYAPTDNPSGAYGEKGDYKGTRILAFNTRTKKAVVVTPGDKGQSVSHRGAIGELSPEAFWATAGDNSRDNYVFAFVSDDTKLGPVVFESDKLNFDGLPKADSSGESNKDSANTTNRELPGWMTDSKKKDLRALESDPLRFSLKFGWFYKDVPVSFTDPVSGYVDPIGQGAREVYEYNKDKDKPKGEIGWAMRLFNYHGRTMDDAKSVWSDFRRLFPLWDDPENFWNETYPDAKVSTDGERDDWYDIGSKIAFLASDARETVDDPNDPRTKAVNDYNTKYKDPKWKYFKTMAGFMQFMWNHPYHRGWLVKVVDRKSDWVDKFTTLPQDLQRYSRTIPVIGGPLSTALELASIPGRAINKAVEVFTTVVKNIVTLGGADENAYDTRQWEFEKPLEAWKIYITKGPDAARTYIIEHSEPGLDSTSFLRVGEEFKVKVFDPIYATFKSVASSVGAVLTGVINMIRLGLMTFQYGLGQAGVVQRQANMLNAMLNDSMYFQGVPGTLTYLVDNPFTREYGEPVVEVREPFQRMHFINSFQHILNNKISENSGVATVVTATSDGKHAQTVYFDKGAPTELQVSKTVESGLLWDKPGSAWGNILHPITTIRGWSKTFAGESDGIVSKRIGLWHLKESLKDIYGGDLITVGDASIRPFDLVYMHDIYERMYGFFEVEQVVHHLTPETGFVTSVTPNALVTIIDPARWSVIAVMRRVMASQALRHKARALFGVQSGTRSLYGLPKEMSVDKLNSLFESEIRNIEYTGGSSAIIKDFVDSASLGFITGGQKGETERAAAGIVAGAALVSGPLMIPTAIFGWKAFSWVRDKLADQHGCYIQYLTKNGYPMDAGLSYNHGVAVGHQKSMSLFGGALRIPTGGQITTNELLSNIGWAPRQTQDLYNDVSWWVSETNKHIQKIAGRSQDDQIVAGTPLTYMVQITNIIDGNTFEGRAVSQIDKDGKIYPLTGERAYGTSYRLAYVNAPNAEISKEFAYQHLVNAVRNQFDDAGLQPLVAVRQDPNNSKDAFGRELVFVFHNAPGATSIDQRNQQLARYAVDWPMTSWDGFHPSGQAYTFNWEMVAYGVAVIDERVYADPNFR